MDKQIELLFDADAAMQYEFINDLREMTTIEMLSQK